MRYLMPTVLLVAALIFSAGCATINQEVLFPDQALDFAIREAIGKPSGPLYIRDVMSIIELDLSNTGVTSLEGISSLSGLKTLSLRGNRIVDIEMVASLHGLKEVDLRDTALSDISFLSSLTNLKELNLRANTITDLSPLSGLRQLVSLNIRDNLVTDIRPLASHIGLADLNLRYNNISDITVLSELPDLVERLYLQGNSIMSLLPVTDYYHLIRDVDFQIGAVTASHPGGVYENPFVLSLLSTSATIDIYYTLDGSEPTLSSNLYSEPLYIDQSTDKSPLYAGIRTSHFIWTEPLSVFMGTIVRARAFVNSKPLGDEIVRTYFVGEDMAARYSDLPIISLVTNPENLFGDQQGIYVPGDLWTGTSDSRWAPANYNSRGDEWERPAFMELYEADGTRAFAQTVGIRVHGGQTRSLPQKALRIYARSDYGKSTISYPVFGESSISEYQRLLLRGSGDDWEFSLIRDGLIQSLFADTHVDTQAYRPAVVFINGEFWGIHNIRERYDQYYIASHHGLNPDLLDRIELTDYQMRAQQGDTTHYEAMLRFLEQNDMSLSQNYDYIKTQMSVDSFIDFLIGHIYSGNRDSMTNNIKYWRAQEPYGLWHWQLFDLDWGFFHQDHDTLGWAAGIINNMPEGTLIFRSLLNNKEFRHQFINRYADLLNTRLLPDDVILRINSLARDIEGIIPEQIDRWGRPASFEYWQEAVARMELFAEQRPYYAREHIMDFFDIPNTLAVEMDLQGEGQIHFNSLVLEGSWAGTYFAGVPLTVSIQASPGFVLEAWTIDGVAMDKPAAQFTSVQDVTIHVSFVRTE